MAMNPQLPGIIENLKSHICMRFYCAIMAILSWSLGGCEKPPLSPPDAMSGPIPMFQSDGDGSVQSTTVINHYGLLASDVLFGSTAITLAASTPPSALGLKPNDLLLIIQMQGAVLDTRNSSSYGSTLALNGAGLFEFVAIKSIDQAAGTLSLYDSCGGLSNSYVARTTQVVRVPQFRSLLVPKGASLGAKPWDGKLGGIIAVRVFGNLTVDGRIDASGQGFRGAEAHLNTAGRIPNVGDYFVSASPLDGGKKGEGIGGDNNAYAVVGAHGRGAPGNGGGGGNRMLAGGGGGANGDNGNPWTGQGVMSPSPNAPGELLAWKLDPAFIANSGRLGNSSGGGRGGYSYSMLPADPRTTPPQSGSWGGDLRRERGGLGGQPVANDVTSRLFLGGGGGGGDTYQSLGGAGGSGGGLVFLIADSITGSGVIAANGASGFDTADRLSGAGGGGAGGTIVVAAQSIGSTVISADGGRGGNQTAGSLVSVEAAGPGGGGGGGFIATSSKSLAVRSVDGGHAGLTLSGPLQLFPENGATQGAGGRLAVLPDLGFGGAPFCSTSDLSIQLTAPAISAERRTPVPYTIAVHNLGPSAGTGVHVTLTLPETAEITDAQGDGWTCQRLGAKLDCTRPNLGAGAESTISLSARPPLSAIAALATARVTSQSVDPVPGNDISEASLDIQDPLSPYGLGGGFTCQFTGSAERARGTRWHAPMLLLFLWLFGRRWKAPRGFGEPGRRCGWRGR